MSETNHSPITMLKEYWFVIVFLVTTGVAWGETKVKINTVEEAVKMQTLNQSEISKLKEGQAVLDERVKHMQEDQQEQKELLKEILTSQKTLNRSINK